MAIAAGERHALALRADGTVVAWGDNSRGQTNVPPGLSNEVAIAAAGYDQPPAVLRADGRVVLWKDTRQFSPPLSNIVAIAPGQALDAEGRLFSVNWSDQVQLLQSNVVAMSGNHALLADGTVTYAGTSSDYLSSLRNVIALASEGDPPLFLVSECPALLSDGAVVPGTRVRLVAPLMPGQMAFRQWYHNGVPVPGATGPVLELPAVRPEDLGTYTVQSHWSFLTLTHVRITLQFAPGLHLFAEPAELVRSPGQEATRHVRVVQAGPDPATATELTGDWTPAFEVLDANASQGEVHWTAGQFTAALGELSASTTAEVRVRLRAVTAGEGTGLLRLRGDAAMDREWRGVFAVVATPPALAVEPLEYGPALSWPVMSGFHLEQTRSLTPPVQWERVASQPNFAGDRFQYRLPFEGVPTFTVWRGLPTRTIRYYIARGLVPPPRKAGPGAHYGEEHLQRLRQIQTWQAEGLTLAEIAQRLAGPGTPTRPPLERTAWWSYAVAPEVMVHVRADTAPWRARHIQRALQELAERLTTLPNEKDSPDANEA